MGPHTLLAVLPISYLLLQRRQLPIEGAAKRAKAPPISAHITSPLFPSEYHPLFERMESRRYYETVQKARLELCALWLKDSLVARLGRERGCCWGCWLTRLRRGDDRISLAL